MHSINEITIDHIAQLSPDGLSQLLHILLKTEAEKNALPNWEILVPLKINVADGGEDGRITWNGTPNTTKWLKNKLTIFQSKATDLNPGACYEEILLPKKENQPRKLKPQVEEVVVNNGCYALYTNQDYNTTLQNRRIAEFRRAIQDSNHANYATVDIRVYDSNQIKDWVNENIAAITFVQSCIGVTRVTNLRTWEEWHNDMIGSQIPYQTNENIDNYIKQIRTQLKKDNVVRVIGHSGLGKTRLVLETFRDKADEPEVKALQAQLVYYDLGMGSLESITSFILSHKAHQSGILVIDNCDENSHNTITGLIRSSGHFKVITIDFSSETNERSVIKLSRENQKDIVLKIVEDEFHDSLTKNDKEYISAQSEGYPQMAILFSESVRANGLEGLNNQLPNDFLKKLVFGRNNESDYEFEIIKACSVLSSFGFVDDNISSIIHQAEQERLIAQSDYVRNRICGHFEGREISAKDFYRICLKYKTTNIIEQRGTRIMVKPTPLAINLAALWWKETPHFEIKNILNELKNDELGQRLVERLAELDQLDKAKEIVNELWGPNSPFGTAEVLNTELGSLLFRYVVEVNPVATVKTLENVFGHLEVDELLKIEKGRRNLVWALEKLCFRNETFIPASKILFSFASAENETWGNNSQNQFKQLFQLFLSGTEANLKDRIKVIQWGLKQKHPNFLKIAISALGRGLINDSYTRMGGADKQGSGAPLEDYRPNWDEIYEFWKVCLEILTDIACSESEYAFLAKENIANSIRSLLRDNELEIFTSISKVIECKGNLWPEALNNLKMTLSFEENLHADVVTRVNNLIDALTPKDIKHKLYLKVTKPEWDTYDKDEDGHYIDKPMLNAVALAEQISEGKVEWEKYIPELLIGEQRQAFVFGKRINELSDKPLKIINIAISELKKIEREKQNPELIGGLLFGAKDKINTSTIIDELIHDVDLQQHVFYLIKILTPSYSELLKLFVLIDKYKLPIIQFKNFQYGRALDNLSNDEIIDLCKKISEYDNAGKWTSLSIIFMYCYGSEERLNQSMGYLKELILSSNMLINNQNTYRLEGHHWSVIVEKILENREEEEFAIGIANQIVGFCEERNFNYGLDTYFSKVLSILFEKYFYVVWETFGKGIIGEYPYYFHLKNMLGTHNGNLSGKRGVAFLNADYYEFIIDWCKQNLEIAPQRIANMSPISIVSDDAVTWHPFTKMLIDEFGDNDDVLRNLSSNMGSFGSVGSSVPYYETQRTILQELLNHEKESVSNWASNMLEYTERAIKREQLNDEQRYL